MVVSGELFVLSDDFALNIQKPECPIPPLAGNFCSSVYINKTSAVIDIQRRAEQLVALTEKRTPLPKKSLSVSELNSVGVCIDLAEVGEDGKCAG